MRQDVVGLHRFARGLTILPRRAKGDIDNACIAVAPHTANQLRALAGREIDADCRRAGGNVADLRVNVARNCLDERDAQPCRTGTQLCDPTLWLIGMAQAPAALPAARETLVDALETLSVPNEGATTLV